IGGLSPQQVYQGGRNVGIEVTPNRERAELTFRVGTVGKGRDARALLTTFPVALHRPLRDDARVTNVAVVRQRFGTKHCFGVRISQDADDWSKPDWATGGEVGIDIGWRVVP